MRLRGPLFLPAVLAAVLFLVLAAASPLRAETFKWVDERGVVNYSNNPPPAERARQGIATVEDRVSTYESEPALREQAARAASPDSAELEWLQRQKYMMQAKLLEDSAAASAGDCSDRAINCGGADAWLPGYAVAPVVVVRPARRHTQGHEGRRRHAARQDTARAGFILR
jgi:hypothetical protein